MCDLSLGVDNGRILGLKILENFREGEAAHSPDC